MSWDIFVSNYPADAKTADDIPEGFVGTPVGTRYELIGKIREVAPAAVFPDRSWGKIEGVGVDVEIRLGESENVSDFVFHVRGSEASAACVADILRHLKLRAVDSASGEFFDLNRPAAGCEGWKACREEMLSKKGPGLAR
ncbi:MAG TPA: hypothetical protein VGV18_02015 [Verrucomicrobiae bacterium]|nr:hypothetical protein [Verrucomicrobiae bacterium]